MKKCIFASLVMIMVVPTLHGASMCMNPASSTSSYISSVQGDGNRGSWTNGGDFIGESHCSNVGIITPETTDADFEKDGRYCWCRLTQVAAPNGYLAKRSGAWVLAYNSCSSNCATNCAYYCARNGRTYPEFRRALFASPGS